MRKAGPLPGAQAPEQLGVAQRKDAAWASGGAGAEPLRAEASRAAALQFFFRHFAKFYGLFAEFCGVFAEICGFVLFFC